MSCCRNRVAIIGAYKLSEYATVPTYGTADSACFDLYACVESDLELKPNQRVLIPTGLILDIPKGHSVRLHPRSGLSLKKGLSLANCEGVIDSDYVEEVFVLMINSSNETQYIKQGDRVCQGELVKNEKTTFRLLDEIPTLKTNRDGGFGSTGE
jgi:dUTP pyrophosphatase